MIRLTLNAQSEPEIHLFNKPTITIGNDSSQTDLTLHDDALQPIHIKILEQNGSLVIINITNDPFVSLNGHPFGKKLLNSGDIILIHETEILFENIKNPPEDSSSNVEDPLVRILDNKIKQQENLAYSSQPFFDLPFEHEVEALKDDDLSGINMDHYLEQIIDVPKAAQAQAKPDSTQKKTDRKLTKSLKDDYLRDLDDDNQVAKQTTDSNNLYQAWRWIFLFILSILSIAMIIGIVIYFSVSDKTEAQETRAAQGVADISMALTHAQLFQQRPQNQNWSDVEFIKHNLQSILPETFSYASEMDSHGHFKYFPYSLRVYTSTDLSHFLLIAQPAPSLLQWLIPKSVILVDSNNMEIRTIKDVKSLNRLLANPEPLDGINGKEISALVKQGDLIPLFTLAGQSTHLDFSPPKELASLKPGAENFIYNAPRYYRLAQTIVQKGIDFATSKRTSQEVANLKHDVSSFSRLTNLILYTPGDQKLAKNMKQGLMTFAPMNSVLFGYLSLNEKGLINTVALLEDKDGNETIALNTPPTPEEALQNIEKNELENIDVNHPLYVQLTSLMRLRQLELQPIVSNLKALVDQEIDNPMIDFQSQFKDFANQVLSTDMKHRKTIKDALTTLYEQYEEMPIEEFLLFVKKTGTENLIPQNEGSLANFDETGIENIQNMLVQMENSKTLAELDNCIHTVCSSLTFDHIKDANELIHYQNLLRNGVLQHLERILLFNHKAVGDCLTPENREILRHILNYERVIKPEEQAFFLEEFDCLAAEKEQKKENNAEVPFKLDRQPPFKEIL